MKIEFAIPTYNRPHHLATLLNSLMAQTNPNWTAHVVADGSPVGTFDSLFEYFKDEPRIRFTRLPERHNDFGHTPRNTGLADCKQEFVCMTGEDNYYVPTFVDEVLNAFDPDTNFVWTDMVHNWGKEYLYIQSILFWGHIDIGNSVFRTEYAKQFRLDTTKHAADWEMIKAFVQRYGGVAHIKKCLYIHN